MVIEGAADVRMNAKSKLKMVAAKPINTRTPRDFDF
jgi:hypothetical protein